MEASIVISLQDNQLSRMNGHDNNAEISSNNMSSGSSEDGSVAEVNNTNNGAHENGVIKSAPKQIATKNGSNSDPDFSGDGGEESEQETDDNDVLEEDEDIMPRKKKAKLSEDILTTPSDNTINSNVRKSGRERKIPKKFDSPPLLVDDDDQPTQKRKYQRKQKVAENGGNDVSYPPSSVNTTSNAASDEDLEDEEENFAAARIASAKRKKIKQKKRKDDSEDEYSDFSDEDKARGWKRSIKKKSGGAKSKPGRKKDKKKYEEEDIDHSSDFMTDQEDDGRVSAAYHQEPEEDVDAIEFVLDHRKGKVGATGENTMHWSVHINGDPNLTLETDQIERQFLIKWKGWSHINNTWESESSLAARKKGSQDIKGYRKLINYQNKLSDFESWKKRASPEDIEYQDIEIEMGRELLRSYMEIERIFASRKNESGGKDYYVKWKNLPYSEATWEDEFNITNYYQEIEALEQYEERISSRALPKHYDSAMKGVNLKFTPMKEQPDFLGSEKFRLREYQLEGLNFLLNAWSKGNSAILADEMGLGKTIQSISFLRYLWHCYSFKGPMLVVVPLSTMAAWQKEFTQWAPQMNTVTYNGNAASREIIRNYEMFSKSGQIIFNVVLTNYEMVVKDRDHFSAVKWSNIVVDEAHRLKSEESLLYKVLQTVESKHRLLLTGTPLQNSLKELWCLLSYIRPVNFEDWETFNANYGTEEDKAGGYVKLHTLLKPYIIRRLKKDVEKSLPPKVEQILRVDMTVRQKRIYKLVLTRNFEALSKGKNQVSLLNVLMQLRKCCNHADLIQELEDGPSSNPAERLKELIYGSGKLLLLDKLLTRFREKGDRVLIFSQMVKLLDLLEEYLSLKRYPFQRLDGSVSADRRKQSIAAFNDEKSLDFCFLLSTKAGGLGINLQTANRVIIFDSDFNPQNDLQAIARAHRIGQKEEVKIFRFVASSSVDEDIIQRAKNKMVLDHLVIQNMDTSGKSVVGAGGGGINMMNSSGPTKIQQFGKEELNLILKFGAQDLFKEEETEQEKEVNLDAILESAEMREEEEVATGNSANNELLSAFKCTTLQFEETEKELEKKEEVAWSDIIPEDLVEMHREKKGIELYSDPEELFNPIAKRRKKRMKHLLKAEEANSSRDNSRAASRAGSEANGSDGEESVLSALKTDDSDMSDGEREMRTRLKAMEAKGTGTKLFRAKKMLCLDCGRKYVDANALVQHMNQAHGNTEFKITAANKLDPADKDSGKLKQKGKRGHKAMNTRCFRCNKTFQHRLGYKLHIKKWHNGEEPPENLDPKNLAKPDDRIECLICEKKFSSANGLKLHIQRLHLGMMDNDKKDGETKEEEDEDLEDGDGDEEKEDGEGGDKDGEGGDKDGEGGEKENKSRKVKLQEKLEEISAEDRKKIEKMYYKLRKYGCKFCQARFNNKTKLIMHEGIHNKQRKPIICPYCEKSYARPDKLKDHCATAHPNRPVPKVPDFVPEQPAKARERVPKGERPVTDRDFRVIDGEYKCPQCPRMYKTLIQARTHHSVIHSKNVRCEYCPAKYNDRKGLYQHMFRKHPNQPMPKDPVIANPFVMSSLSHPPADPTEDPLALPENPGSAVAASNGLDELQPLKLPDGSIRCPLCPKTYTSAGGFWIHKRNRHPQWFNATSKSAVRSPAPLVAEQPQPSGQKFWCELCGKVYASYASLYHHRKTIHPHTLKKGSSGGSSPALMQAALQDYRNLARLAPKPSPMVVNVGGGGVSHTCLKCGQPFHSLRDLATHIEQKHQMGGPNSELMAIENPLINNVRMFGEVDISPVRNGGATNADGSPRKYREKCYKCPQCGKAYNDAERLKNHIHDRHTAKFFDDIEPNTDVVVKNHHSKLGYEIYKILCVYTTGMRMKGVKLRYDPAEKVWRLTEQIDKHVSKRDVIMILTTLKRCGEKRYKMDDQEYMKMTTTVNRVYMEEKSVGRNTNDDEENSIEDPLALSGNAGGGVIRHTGSMNGVAANARRYSGEDNDDFEDEDGEENDVEDIGEEGEEDSEDGESGSDDSGEEEESESESDDEDGVLPTPARKLMGLSKPPTPTPTPPKPVQVVPNGTTIQYVHHIEQQPTFSTTTFNDDDIILQEAPDTVLSYDGNTLDFGAATNHLDLAASLHDLESLLNP